MLESLAVAMTEEQLKPAALQLDPSDHEALAEELLLSIDAEQNAAAVRPFHCAS
jgi:hypothetical protein